MATSQRTAGSGHWKRAIFTALLLFTPGRATASGLALAVGAGYDYQAGPAGETWNAPLAFGTMVVDGGDATLSLSRYHSSEVGWGWSGAGNVGLSFSSRAGARVIGIRSIGDGDYRAWRAEAGPTIQLDEDRSLFLYGAHLEDNRGARLNQIGAEGNAPLGVHFSGLASAAFGKWEGSESSAQGTAGVTWSRWKELQVIGQATFGKNIVGPPSAESGGSTGPLGVGGRGHSGRPTTGPTSALEAAAFVGIRLMVP